TRMRTNFLTRLAAAGCLLGSVAHFAGADDSTGYGGESLPRLTQQVLPPDATPSEPRAPLAIDDYAPSSETPPLAPEAYGDEGVPPAGCLSAPWSGYAPSSNGCMSCASGYPYNRCGCESQTFPWFRGSGACDQWCVGPHWEVEMDGLIWRRQDADLARLTAAVGVGPDMEDQFDFGPGARVKVTGYNDSGFGLQVVYEGINNFGAGASYGLAGSTRFLDYRSSFNSIEINFLRRDPEVWKLFGGIRYLQLDDDLVDETLVDKVIPAPANPPAATVAYVDVTDAYLMENRLLGFQLGALRDGWKLNRWLSIETFCNGGLYLNDLKRETVTTTAATVITGDDLSTPNDNEFSQTTTTTETATKRSFSELAFVGEAGVTAVLRLNRCTALRGGYQALLIDGAGEGIDAFFNAGFDRRSLLVHGLQVGLEYRR
ncbi:MAG: BBP7 family outer membrane beta-barrel protein, partial [Planctomycetales bacterium]|nr:BBP7 family outer membrane beta-barrel protein [Planctomycetales bacterium]